MKKLSAAALLALCVGGVSAQELGGSSQFGPVTSGQFATDASRVSKAGDTMTGALVLTGAAASVQSGSSITASAFFGDGSGLTNVSAGAVDHTTGTITSGKFGDTRVSISSGAMVGFGPPTVSSLTVTGSGGISAAASSVTASAFFGDGSHLSGISVSVDHTTGTITSGKFGDNRVAISSGAILGFGPPTVSSLTVANSALAVNTQDLVVSAGNVGVGTTDPQVSLDVLALVNSGLRVKSTFGNAQLFLDRGQAGFDAGISFRDAGGPGWNLGENAGEGGQDGAFNILLFDGVWEPYLTILRSGEMGIGTSNPTALLDISSSPPAGALDAALVHNSRYSDDTLAGGFIGRKARGTEGSPSAALANDDLVAIGGRAFDGTKFSTGSLGLFRVIAEENQTDTAWGTYFRWDNSAAGTNLRREVMRLTSAGRLGIGTSNPVVALDVTSTTQGAGIPSLTTAQVQASTPGRAGALIFNSDLSKVCVSTSTTAQGYARVDNGATCQ